MANVTDYRQFYDPSLGNANISSYPIDDPTDGSESGWHVQSIGPGQRMYTFADGEIVITDDYGNIIG